MKPELFQVRGHIEAEKKVVGEILRVEGGEMETICMFKRDSTDIAMIASHFHTY